MLKIEKTVESGIDDWLLVEADFSSLQMRLAMQDEALNKDGIDLISYELYGEGNSGDAHSVTGFNVFCESIGRQIIEISDGVNTHIFLPEQKIKIKRDGKEMEILGEEFRETDEFEGLI